MIGLQTRLTLAFLLLVGAVTGGTTTLLYQRTQDQFHADFDDRIRVAKEAVRLRLMRDAESLRARVEAAARDPRMDVLLQDLEHGRFEDDPGPRKRLLSDVDALRGSAHLDVLWVLDKDADGRVLAAPHRTGNEEPTGTLRRYLRGGLRDHAVVTEPVDRGGRPVVVPVLEVGVARERLMIVGGRVLGQGVAEDLRIGAIADMQVTIRDREGRVIATTLSADEPEEDPAGYETERVVHRNSGEDQPALIVSVHLSRAALERRLDGLVRATGFVAGAAGLVALLLGWLSARRITRPVQTLVNATRQVAAGDRNIDLAVGRRDEVGELMDAFSNMAHELDESEDRLRRSERVAAWSEIARELAHEIKNPLTPIQMAIETVRRTHKRRHPKFDEVFEESTVTILEEVNRLKTIVTEFSQFARMPRPNPQPYELNELVHQAVVLYREEDGVEVVERLSEELEEQLLDPDRMTQVIQNLLKNAIQATRAVDRPGRVRIATKRLESGEAELSVEDNGCGIAEEDLPRVFTPYFTSKAGGTGLGLAVVHRIVTGHDGRIGVSSKPGEGTRFVVRLPA